MLLGFLPEQEALQALASGKDSVDIESLRQTWRRSAETVSAREPFAASCDVKQILHPEVGNGLDESLGRVKARLADDPFLGSVPWSFREVEIDGLVSIQKQINVDAADETVETIKGPEDFEGAIKRTLLTELPKQNVLLGRDANGFMVSSRNLNLEVTGFGLGDHANPSTKENMKSAALQFGCLLSYVRVVHFMDRYYLRDGYHRVYGLKKKGFTHTPCILIEGSSPADIGISPGLFPLELVLSPNPPLLRDFFENATNVQVPRMTKVLRVKIEPMVIPA